MICKGLVPAEEFEILDVFVVADVDLIINLETLVAAHAFYPQARRAGEQLNRQMLVTGRIRAAFAQYSSTSEHSAMLLFPTTACVAGWLLNLLTLGDPMLL